MKPASPDHLKRLSYPDHRAESGRPVRVLVVDDSDFARAVIIEILSKDPGIEVIGEAVNGLAALQMIPDARPDIVTMDIHMPVMDGLTAIEKIMARHAVPILVLTSVSDAQVAFLAISKGALEVMAKPEFSAEAPELVRKIKLLSKIPVISHIRSNALPRREDLEPGELRPRHRLVAIAASTGGPKALSTLFSAMNETFPVPIVVAQHMAEHFTNGLVTWLNRQTPLTVKIAEPEETPQPGTIYLSPPEQHIEISPKTALCFRKRKAEDIHTPSCDAMMISAANVYRSNVIGIILSGMGADGVQGMKRIRAVGGITIAQDEASSVIFGMPKAAIESGCIDIVAPVDEIYPRLLQCIDNRWKARRSPLPEKKAGEEK